MRRPVSERTALLLMDVQQGIVDRMGDGTLLNRLGQAAAAARASGMLVVYVRVAFREGYPEVSPNNRSFSAISSGGRFTETDPATHFPPPIAPQSGDVVVTKRRVSAFSGSDLALVLRSRGIDTLVLTGIATSGVVLSTVREAADLDFRLAVLADGCADGDAEVHRVLVEKVFPRQAEVLSVADWVGRIG